MLGGCTAVISTVLGPTKFFTGVLLVITTGWLGSKWHLALYLYIIYLNSIHSVMEIVVVKFQSLLTSFAAFHHLFIGDRLF